MKKSSNLNLSSGATGPDPRVVLAIVERARMFELEEKGEIEPVQAETPVAVESTTMQLYRPLTEMDEALKQAATNLSLAVARGDEAAMQKHFDEIRYFEQGIRESAGKVRSHLVQKAYAHSVEGAQHG